MDVNDTVAQKVSILLPEIEIAHVTQTLLLKDHLVLGIYLR